MCLNLYTYWFKAIKYSYASTSLKSMATTKTYNKFRKAKRKGTQAHYKRKSNYERKFSNHKRKDKNKLMENYKTGK